MVSASGEGGGLSPHPADELIRELIQTGRPAGAAEIERILQRMETAPFDPQIRPTPDKLRDQAYLGRKLGPREPTLIIHLAQRMLGDEQWRVGTTAAEDLTDLRKGLRAPGARLAIYADRGGVIAASFGPNSASAMSRGARPEPWLFVVYSADRGMLITGYQVSGLHTVRIPGSARWLT